MIVQEQDYASLEHYGVLGMRWGVRRSNPSAGRAASKTRRSIKSKGRKETSDLKTKQAVNEKLGNKKGAKNAKLDMKISKLKTQRDLIKSDIDLVNDILGTGNPVVSLLGKEYTSEQNTQFLQKREAAASKKQTKIDRLERRYR